MKKKRRNLKKVTITEKATKSEYEFGKEEITEFIVIPPNGGWGWVVVLVAFFYNMMIDGIIYSFGAFLKEISESLNAGSDLVIASSILSGLYFIMGPFVCAMCNRMGFIAVGVTGGLLATLGLLASSFVYSSKLFMLTYGVIFGVASSMTYISNVLAVAFYFDSLRAIATSLAVCGSPVGIVIIGPVCNVLLAHLTWRKKFWLLASGTFLVALLGFCFKPIPPSRMIGDWEPKKPNEEDKCSLHSELIDKISVSTLSKKHNQQYRTNADVVAKGSFLVNPLMGGPSISKSSFKSYKTWLTNKSTVSFISDRMATIMEEGVERSKLQRFWALLFRCCKHQCNEGMTQRPMYKDDILYTGSVTTLPQYDRQRMKYEVS